MDYAMARDIFLQSLIREKSTLDNYRRGIDLFINWSPPSLAILNEAHVNLLVQFAQWLLEYEYCDGETYAPSTARLYLRGVRRWFDWLGVNGYLPARFPLALALHNFDDGLKASAFYVDRQPPEPPDMQQIIDYYDRVHIPSDVNNPARIQRYVLTAFRDRALVHCLADSGGRISEVLALNVGDFPRQAFQANVWKVKVRGKGKREYYLWIKDALPFIDAYIEAQGDDVSPSDPLFVNHLRNVGLRMSRESAGHVVRKAAQTLGLGTLGPHQFRHWKATQLRNAGVSIEDIAFILGHRSIQTTKDYYARVDLERVANLLRDL